MRRAMICVSVMLAMFQVWPMVFGQRGEAGAAQAAAVVPQRKAAISAVPQAAAAVISPAIKPVAGKVVVKRASAMPTCFQQYQRVYAQCGNGDPSCQLRAGDHWDVCEATGFWPAG